MDTFRHVLLPREYSTVKFVRVQNAKLAAIHRIVFLLVLAYILLWQIVAKKGYQQTDIFSGSPLLKVKGIAITNTKTKEAPQAYDAADLVNPALEESAVFLQTNFHQTTRQRRSTCSGIDTSGGVPAYVSEVCGADGKCVAGVPTANGVTTGACIDTNSSDPRVSRKGMGWMCEIEAWCPLEDEARSRSHGEKDREGNTLVFAGNFTVFVRVDGKFSMLAPNQPLSNFKNRSLVWNKNLFYVADILAAAETGEKLLPVELGRHQEGLQVYPHRLDYKHFKEAAAKGAEVIVDMEFNCDLDFAVERCEPSFSFSRVDGGKGFNYRSSNEYYTADRSKKSVKYRDLIKRYGIRIVFRVKGQGGKFSLVECSLVLGSGIGLLGVATVFTDMLLHYSKRNRVFIKAKYQQVTTSVETQSVPDQDIDQAEEYTALQDDLSD